MRLRISIGIAIVFFLKSILGFGYLYGEHKKIGDAAFKLFLRDKLNKSDGSFFFNALLDEGKEDDGFGFLSVNLLKYLISINF